MPTAVEEKDAIREVLAEYCFRLDDSRFAEMAALFTEDGTWETAFGRATGRAAIAELARSLRERAAQPRPRAIHLVTRDRSRRGARRCPLQLDRGAEQSRGSEDRLGRRLHRRDGEGRRNLALPLPQDRALHRSLSLRGHLPPVERT